jgi:fatty-acyl-CoA synthase
MHPDNYAQIMDHKKDIISGGENISTIEVETAIYRHPDVLEVAVVTVLSADGTRKGLRLRALQHFF